MLTFLLAGRSERAAVLKNPFSSARAPFTSVYSAGYEALPLICAGDGVRDVALPTVYGLSAEGLICLELNRSVKS